MNWNVLNTGQGVKSTHVEHLGGKVPVFVLMHVMA